MKIFAPLFACFVLLNTLQAQAPHKCGADDYMHIKLQDPGFRSQFENTQRKVQQQLTLRSPSCANPLILPVAVHFSGGVTNANIGCINDIVQAQIDVLNQDFGGYNGDLDSYCEHSANCPDNYAPTAMGGGTCIQFCLATLDHPAGYGLVDGQGAYTFGQFIWDGDTNNAPGFEGYINLFVSNISPPGTPANLLGVAPISGAADPDANGSFIGASYFGGSAVSCTSGVPLNNSGSFNLGRTATHELGHYFGLQHTFASSNNCNGAGDGIDDTPTQDQPNSGNPTVDYSDCSSTAVDFCAASFFMNYMDYSHDQSLIMFTSQQSDVIKATADQAGIGNNVPFASATSKCSATALATIDYNPTYPSGCPANQVPNSDFTTDVSTFSFCPQVAVIPFEDMSTGFPTSWSWTFSGAGVIPTSSTEQNPTVTLSTSGTLVVTLTATNGAGSDGTPETKNYSVTVLDPAGCSDCGSTFLDSGGANGNYSANENISYTLCADPGEGVSLTFSEVGLAGGLFEDFVRIYDGPSVPADIANFNYIIGENSTGTGAGVWANISGNNWTFTGNTYTTCAQCVSFLFIENGDGDLSSGWQSEVMCIPSSCSDGVQSPCEDFVDCGSECGTPCPTVNEGFVFTDNGGDGNMVEGLSNLYTLCAEENDQQVLIDWDLISTGNVDVRIYEGQAASGFPAYLMSGSLFCTHEGGGSYGCSGQPPLIESVGQCYTVTSEAATNSSTAGFRGFVSACDPGVCPPTNEDAGPFVYTVDTRFSCPGSSLINITTLTGKEQSESRACSPDPTLTELAFFLVECGSGGLLEVDASANSEGGTVDLALYGPVTGTCPNLAGGSYVDCESDIDPEPVSTTVNAGERYLVVVATGERGMVELTSTAGASALPVDLLSFDALYQNSKVLLEWQSASEVNNARYTLARSSDGQSYTHLAHIAAENDATTGAIYEHTDARPQQGLNYYRLSQTDIDGSTDILGYRVVDVRRENVDFAIYPNPVSGREISFGGLRSEAAYTVTVYDLHGGLVLEQKISSGESVLDVDTIAGGVYLVMVSDGATRYTSKFVKLSE